MSTSTSRTPSAPPSGGPAGGNTQTRARLLEAAGQAFAEHGFRGATVRNICERAGANVAAVNYHFGDKQQLYTATLHHWLDLSLKQYPLEMGVGPGATPEERLRGFVRGFLYRMLARGTPAYHGQIMAREMIEPTEAMDDVVRHNVRPIADRLNAVVRDLVGADVDDDTVRKCALSVVGQCCFYRHAKEMLARLYPDMTHEADALDRLADHITRFSLAGLRGCTGPECRVEKTRIEDRG